jgi:hypothetical protein
MGDDLRAYYGVLRDRMVYENHAYKGSGKPWTKLVLECFRDLAPEGTSVHCRPAGGGPDEWMFDLTWSKGDPRSAEFAGLRLALECEWGWDHSINTEELWSNAILEDLNKLLVAKSASKVLVFEPPKWHGPDNDLEPCFEIVTEAVGRCGLWPDEALLAVLTSEVREPLTTFRVSGRLYLGNARAVVL